MRKAVLALAVLAIGAFVFQTVYATHFRYGHTTWKNTSGNTVEVQIQNAWRRDADGCVNKTVAGPRRRTSPAPGPAAFPASATSSTRRRAARAGTGATARR